VVSNHPAGDGHDHAVRPDADRRYLAMALGLIVAFLAFEITAAVVGHSLTLLADAGHMLTDVGALAASLVAARLATRPPSETHTYGLKRAEILAAAGNGITLLIVSTLISFEAVVRLIHPQTVHGALLIVVALVGVAVNIAASMTLARADRRSLNVEGAFQHIVTDLYAFIGTLVAGVVIVTTGFARADAVASLVVAVLMVYAGVRLLWQAGRVLMEAAPAGIDPEQVGRALADHPHVVNVHDLHVWEVTSGFPSLSAHVLVHPRDDCHAIRLELEGFLHERFGIDHTTLQVDHAPPEFLEVGGLTASTRRAAH
jgi:cobalt-zinc-cadmium efflux system protein